MREQYITVPAASSTCTSRAWVRNPNWLTLPSLSDGDSIIYILHRVRDGVPNFFSFFATIASSGTYSVDLYNDGTTVTSHSHNTTAHFDLDYSKGTTEVTAPNGDTYKQVITKITGNFLKPQFYKRHGSVQAMVDSTLLSVKMASQTCTSLDSTFRGGSTTVMHRSLEEFEFVGTCNVTTLLYAFTGAPNLGKVTGTFSSLTTIQQAFNSVNISDLTEMELGSVSGMACTQAFISSRIREMFHVDFFKGATSANATFQTSQLQYFGKASAPMQMNALSGATGIYRMFYQNTKLKAAYFTSCAPERTEQMFHQCYVLETVSGIDCTSLSNATNMFNDCHSLSTLEISNMAISFSLDDCNFNQAGLVNIFNDLASASL